MSTNNGPIIFEEYQCCCFSFILLDQNKQGTESASFIFCFWGCWMREEASVFFYCVKTVAVNHWVFALSNFVRVGRKE